MKVKRLFVSVCVLMLLLPVSSAMASEVTPVTSWNLDEYLYTTYYAKKVDSYLYEWDDKLVRVEYTGGKIIVEEYNQNYRLLSQREVELELPIWGGFFAGTDYNFVIVGQNNEEEDDSVEVIRVIKYDKNWNRLGHRSISGIYTVEPFRAGSLRCAEDDENLYIHTSHEMYMWYDGLNHQSNLTFEIKKEDLSISRMSGIWPELVDSSFGFYVSHSFNQFILVDQEGNVVTLDHGDGYPRGVALGRAPSASSAGRGSERVEIFSFEGEIGNNLTGATIGGLAETSEGYVTAFNYLGLNSYFTFTPKDDFSKSATEITVVCVSDELDSFFASPLLLSTGLDGGYILWKNGSTDYDLYCASYNSSGELGETKNLGKVSLSDCKPIYINGKFIWYVTRFSVPTFYELTEDGISTYTATWGSTFSDVDEGAWFYEAVEYAYEQRIMTGMGEGVFAPDAMLSRAQAVQILYNLEGQPEVVASSGYTDTVGHWAEEAINWAAENEVVSGVGNNRFDPDSPVSREQFTQMLYNYASFKGYDLSISGDLTLFSDVDSVSDWAVSAMSWANGNGLINGNTDGTINPAGTTTRAQAASILMSFDLNVAGN